MKKSLLILLIACLAVALFSACDIPTTSKSVKVTLNLKNTYNVDHAILYKVDKDGNYVEGYSGNTVTDTFVTGNQGDTAYYVVWGYSSSSTNPANYKGYRSEILTINFDKDTSIEVPLETPCVADAYLTAGSTVTVKKGSTDTSEALWYMNGGSTSQNLKCKSSDEKIATAALTNPTASNGTTLTITGVEKGTATISIWSTEDPFLVRELTVTVE